MASLKKAMCIWARYVEIMATYVNVSFLAATFLLLLYYQKDEGESTVETVANSVDVGNGKLRWKSTKSALTLLRRQYSDKQLVEGRILEIE